MNWKEVRLEAEQIAADVDKVDGPSLEDLPKALEDFSTVSVLLGVAADRLKNLGSVFPAHNPARRLQELLLAGLNECEKQRFVLTRAYKDLLNP